MARSETPDRDGAFPRLSDGQIAALAAHGTRRETRAGEALFREGDERYDFFVVLAGTVTTLSDQGTDAEQLIAVHGPGRFLGELSLLTGQPAFFTAVVQEPGAALQVPVEHLRRVVAQDPALGDLVLRAYMLRRELLVGLGAGLKIVGSRFTPDTRRLRDFAARNRIPHRWIDPEQDLGAEALLAQLDVPPSETPVVISGERVLRNPSNVELGMVLGLREVAPPTQVCDLVVVGAGPAGLAAAVYGASEGLATVALDGVATGGQASTSSRIENYLGFPSGISGAELAERATIQARKFGARLGVGAEATALERRDGHYAIALDDGETVETRTVVVATGARYRKLPVERLAELEGAGVYYAATLMEAQLCLGDAVAVVGGGNSAGQATVFLAEHARHVYLLLRHDDLGRDYALPPAGPTVLEALERAGVRTIGVGKIEDIFSRRGLVDSDHTGDNETSIHATVRFLDEAGGPAFVFTNLVDFDMVYGHRRDAEGYARCLERLDARLPEVTATLGDDDWLFLTADHGCDPTAPGTDHTREFTPMVAFSPGGTSGRRLGDRATFADLGATIAELFAVPSVGPGHSFASDLR